MSRDKSDSLDNKLREILETHRNATPHPYATKVWIAQIKQAFADEGYVHVPQVEVVTRYERGKKPEVFMVNGKEVMTGQEWYGRFKKELKADPVKRLTDNEMLLLSKVLEAAKKAAGIK